MDHLTQNPLLKTGNWKLAWPFGESQFSAFHFILYVFQVALLLSCSCSKNGTEPPDNLPPSHDFVWQVDTVGTRSSHLSDVAIINENDIWAVGEIHTPETDREDSLGNWVQPYNAVHWNGQEWELMRIQFKIFCNQNATQISPANSILAFNEDDIWIAAGSQIAHWDGISQNILECIPVSVNQLWGTSSQNIYAAGAIGKIAHYDGSRWQSLESGTTVDIQDIWGALNPQTGEYEILAIASERFQIPQAKQLLQIQDTRVTTLSDSGLPFDLSSLWFVPGQKYYVSGDGLYYTPSIGPSWQLEPDQPLIYKDAIRGNGLNDIIIAGSFGLVSHYNGIDWRQYRGEEVPDFFGRYVAVDFKNNLVIAVGFNGIGQGIILRGDR